VNKRLRRVVRGEKVYVEDEILRYGEIKEKVWKCYDQDGYLLHSGHFSSLDNAIKQLEGIR
jgi:hypothetical protein